MANGWHRKATTPAVKARAAEYASARHKRERKTRVAAATERTPCGYCGKPLGPNSSSWHVPHDEHRNYLPGLWHAACNRKEAARRGALKANAGRKARRSGGRATKLTWLEQDNHECPVCKGPVKWATSRTCSRECAYRLRFGRPRPGLAPMPACRICGVSLPKRVMRYCPAHQGYQPRWSSKPCAQCGEPMMCKQGPKTYCSACMLDRRREYRREYKRQRRLAQRG